jgi:hypothetical protein
MNLTEDNKNKLKQELILSLNDVLRILSYYTNTGANECYITEQLSEKGGFDLLIQDIGKQCNEVLVNSYYK